MIQTLVDLDELGHDAGFWYLASPYSGYTPRVHMDTPARLAQAFGIVAAAAGWLIGQRVPVFSPIAHSHAIAEACSLDPLSLDVWLPVDEPFMTAATGLLVLELPGWRHSAGVKAEMTHFQMEGKPAWLLPWPSNCGAR